jgi:hypothetical protein
MRHITTYTLSRKTQKVERTGMATLLVCNVELQLTRGEYNLPNQIRNHRQIGKGRYSTYSIHQNISMFWVVTSPTTNGKAAAKCITIIHTYIRYCHFRRLSCTNNIHLKTQEEVSIFWRGNKTCDTIPL